MNAELYHEITFFYSHLSFYYFTIFIKSLTVIYTLSCCSIFICMLSLPMYTSVSPFPLDEGYFHLSPVINFSWDPSFLCFTSSAYIATSGDAVVFSKADYQSSSVINGESMASNTPIAFASWAEGWSLTSKYIFGYPNLDAPLVHIIVQA